jgi:AbrB family looped-hinge helix DNA binding protein
MPRKRAPREKLPVAKKLFPTGRVSSKGWVVIPKSIRDEMGLKPGDIVQFSVLPPLPNMKQEKALNVLQIFRVPEDPVTLMAGMFKRKPGEPLMTQRLVEEHRREVAEEERKVRASRRRHRTSA